VVLGARDGRRGEEAQRRIAAAAANQDVHVVVGDLSSQTAVNQMVEELQNRFDSLDVLINNAGVDVGRRQVTVDGLELTFAVNYMAPFVLTTGLLGLLKANAPARVLNVVSGGYKGGKLDFDNLQSERRFSGQRAYNNSKLALLIFTYELARRMADSGVTVNAVDPGFVRGTDIGRTLPLGYQLIAILMWPFMANVQKGADTIIWGATDPSLSDTTGRYFKRRKELTTGSPTHDADLARRLWEASERLRGSRAET
jgi:NAD(P)-dependent dehydrogenase (short-subunit alcohol dehydrogenase family)